MEIHVQYCIYLECKKCGHKNKKYFVLRLESKVHIGCDNCKEHGTTFTVRKFMSWSSTSDHAYIRITK